MKKSFYLSGLLFISALMASLAANATVPTVTANPKNDTVCSGAVAKFYIAAVDTPGGSAMTYSWQVSTNGGATWDTVRDTVFYAGAGSDTLTVTSSVMLNGNMYRGIATNSEGADTSLGGLLKVDSAFAGVITGPSGVCRSSSITLSSSVGGGTWASGDVSLATVSGGGVITGMPAAWGSDTIRYTLINVCGTSVSWTLIHVDSTVIAAPITGPSLTCTGHYIALFNSNTAGAHLWSSSNTAVANVTSSGLVVGAGYGTATITYNFSTACNSVTSTFSVAVDTLLNPGVISGGSGVCVGSWIHLTESVSGGIWLSSSSAVAIVDGSGNVTGVSHGTVAVSYLLSNGCGTSVATHAVSVSAPASMITGPDSIGIGMTRLLLDSTSGGTWTVADTSIATIDSTGHVTGVTTGTTNVTYSVTNVCGTTWEIVNIHVGPGPSAGAVVGPDSVCLGLTVPLSNPTVPGGVWTSSADTVATVSSTGVVSGLMYGAVNISYTFTNGFGSTTIIKTIFVNQPPVVSVTGPSSVMLGTNYLLRGLPYGGVWTASNNRVAVLIATLDSMHLVSYGSIVVMDGGRDTFTYTVHNTCGTRSDKYVLLNTSGVNLLTKAGGSINIYPNPTEGEFTFSLVSDNNEPAVVTITNILGEQVKEMAIATNKNYNMLLDAPAGMYLITANTASGRYSGKLTIIR